MPIVVIERGNDKGRSVKVEPGKKYVFGRDPAAAITLSDPLTSRRHFEIEPDGKGFVLRDLGSTNGTFLNDEKVDAEPIRVGDKIQVGETILSFLSDQREETAQGLVGKTIGGYKLLERVGRGGMGTVYKANQLSLNRIVAFKVLSARLLRDEKFIEKFKSEARSAGQLNHPNIVGVYDVGTDRDIHFFSMEFMDGGSVQDLIGKDEKLSWEEALDVLMQASRALIFAEKKGIVHRDVKPDNLMLTSDGQTKLADLGLAMKTGASDGPAEEGIFGTPHFISPEQAQGQDVDHRADLYSLGATAYRMLSGRTPFRGANVTEIIQAQITKQPEPLKQFCPDAPEELVDVVGRLMRKKPEERYASAEELLAELERIRLKYHLKVHGGGGGKGMLAAAGVALVAVLAVIVFAVTRDNGGNGNGNTVMPSITPTTIQSVTTIVQTDPKEIQRQKELAAENAYLRVTSTEATLGTLSETGLEKAADWKKIAEAFDDVAKEHVDTPYGKKAGERAKAIRDEIERQRVEEEQRQETAKALWLDLKAEVNDLLAEGRFADALARAEAARDKPDLKAAVALAGATEEVEGWLGEQAGSIRARFSAAWTERKDRVEELRNSESYVEAVAAIRTFLETAAGSEKRDPFGKARTESDALIQEIREDYRGLLQSQLGADRTLYYRTWLAARHLEDCPTAFPDNPVFEFRFEDAAARFEALLGEPGAEGALATDLFRPRAGATAARLREIAALLDSLVEHVNRGDLLDDSLDFPPSITGGTRVTLKLNREDGPPADREGLNVIKKFAGTSAVGKDKVHWSDFLPSDLWDFVFLGGRRYEMSAKDHARAALFLAVTGRLIGLEGEIAAGREALSPADRTWLTGELAAMKAHDVIVQAQLTRPPAEWIALANRFVMEHCGSDFFCLVYEFPDPWQRLHAESVVTVWIEKKLAALK